ncbi:MAG TPA: hypothetical protein VJP76_01455, partial [Candidatus Tumulicola sp.]|nr:hypothetical protein [Candidatus Tumulicola sp.]
ALAACFAAGRHAPSSAATPVPGAAAVAAGPAYDGCPIFPPGDPAYNRDLSNAPVAPDSNRYAQSLGTNRSWDDDRIEYINVADGGALVPVASKVRWHSMPPQPWQPSYRIEPVADAHSFVLDTATCHLYELYQTTYDGRLSAYSGGNWDLRRPFVPNPPGRSSAVASGISMFAGAIKYRELLAGRIDHALFLIVPYGMLAQWSFVRPASSTDGQPYRGSGDYALPYGARLRLRPDFPENGAGPQARAVFRALKTYGAIVGDTGCCYKLVYMNDPLGADAFDDRDLAAVHAIGPSDWQVLALPGVLRVPGH